MGFDINNSSFGLSAASLLSEVFHELSNVSARLPDAGGICLARTELSPHSTREERKRPKYEFVVGKTPKRPKYEFVVVKTPKRPQYESQLCIPSHLLANWYYVIITS